MSSSRKLIESPKDVVDLAIFAYVTVQSVRGIYFLVADTKECIVETYKSRKAKKENKIAAR